jgi:serine/threonine-protein phosphatase 2B regulatory subunit
MGCCCGGGSKANYNIPTGWRDLFSALKLTRSDVNQLLEMFNRVDLDGSGSVDLIELLTLLDIDRTRFTEQIFTIFDSDGSGKLDFREFVLSVWNYCTVGDASLDIFAFDLYDTDSSGVLSPSEMANMLQDIYGKKHAHDARMKAYVCLRSFKSITTYL